MAFYALKRFGAVLLILVVMSVLVFLATHALPANTAALILGQYSTPETQAALEHKLGLDLPLPVQYWHWARGILLHGDLGQSLIMERPIAPILWDALGKSAILSVAAMAVVFRIWGSAWLGHTIVLNSQMNAGSLMADGPYRYVRNPLYLGVFCMIAALALLMPATGALFSLMPPENATGNFTKVVQRVPVKIAIDPADAAAANWLRAGLSVTAEVDTRGPHALRLGLFGAAADAAGRLVQ